MTTSLYGLDMELERLLDASFPEPGAAEEVRRLFAADLGTDRLGLGIRLEGGEIRFAFPTAIVVGHRPSPVGSGAGTGGER